jgi:hypothetical protein
MLYLTTKNIYISSKMFYEIKTCWLIVVYENGFMKMGLWKWVYENGFMKMGYLWPCPFDWEIKCDNMRIYDNFTKRFFLGDGKISWSVCTLQVI